MPERCSLCGSEDVTHKLVERGCINHWMWCDACAKNALTILDKYLGAPRPRAEE